MRRLASPFGQDLNWIAYSFGHMKSSDSSLGSTRGPFGTEIWIFSGCEIRGRILDEDSSQRQKEESTLKPLKRLTGKRVQKAVIGKDGF